MTATKKLGALAISACAALFAPGAFADGEGCSASQKASSDGQLKKAEAAEKAGKDLEAYKIVTQDVRSLECAGNGYKRRDGILERTSRKLGAEAEKAGRHGDAHAYYLAPSRNRADYPLADADRAMLKHAKANPENHKIVSQALSYLENREGKPHLKEVQALASAAGSRALAAEEKAFATRRDTLKEIQKAKEWLDLTGEGRRATARADQRGDTVLGEGTVRSVELALEYYGFSGNTAKEKQAQQRAAKLGDEAARKGEHGQAARYYELSGDPSRVQAAEKQKEKTESKRQDKFKQDQKSLEKELGL